MTRSRFLIALAVLALLGVAGWSIAPRTTAVTCTSAAGVARTWTTSTGGLHVGLGGSASSTAEAPNGVSAADKAAAAGHPDTRSDAEVLAQLQQVMVIDAIDHGIDPITAAHQFGPWTVPGATGARLAHAMDPATYGWHCP